VLTATASSFDEDWGVKPACSTCPSGYTLSTDGKTCTAALTENTNYCFTLCKGDVESNGNYGMNGAQIYQTSTTTTPVSISNSFYGGNCTCVCLACRVADPSASASTPSPLKMATLTDSSTITKSLMATSAAAAVTPLAISTGSCQRTDYTPNSVCQAGTAFCGRLINAGLWLCMGSSGPTGEWIGFESCLDIPEAKTYYIGYAVDNRMRIYIDGTLWQQMTDDVQPNFRYWWVKPYTFNTTGTHHIRVEFYNSSGAASAAVEVYNNTFAELTSSSFDGSQAHILFSTANVLGTCRASIFWNIRAAHIADHL
jgi:hypothetical protein